MILKFLLAAMIQLTGVTGENLKARAFFDANNVTVGDPLILTIDFLGDADFAALHPPSLSRIVNQKDWKLDDASAKTDTFRDARRLTYRVRPMREGVLWFPSLEFGYTGKDGARRTVRANKIPVHARGGRSVDIGELTDEAVTMPTPPEFVSADWHRGGRLLTEDEMFRWRRALVQTNVTAFAEFDFPAARLNEATRLLLDGNWAKAMEIYTKLEWRVGQTPEIERGIVAALALKYDNPAVELPMWRQVLRPILRFPWWGRVGLVAGGFAVLALLVWLLGRGVRAVACVVFALLMVLPADAQGVFQQMEEEMERMREEMNQAFGTFSFSGMERHQPVKINVSATTSEKTLQVGTPFEFIVSLEYPKTSSVGQIRIAPSETFGLVFTGPAQNLTDGVSANPSNVVKRLALPARYDVPYRGALKFSVQGQVSGRRTKNNGFFTMSFSNSFRAETPPLSLAVQPLPTAGQPNDFSGIISEGLNIQEQCDLLTVETNDVITITYQLSVRGFVPQDFMLPGAAFEWGQNTYRRFFVADGAKETPRVSVSYYDPRTKSYKKATAGGTPLRYRVAERQVKNET